ncbi:MAG TPA: hypothetical protein VGN63_05600 [Flavisolibacter sp.]|jgi:hypothetical protein|nr:hypothetical protein [Flavisolibacter sp.]
MLTKCSHLRIFDPSNRDVLLPKDLCLEQEGAEPLLPLPIDDCQRVIETPACIIEMSPERIFYFRSVDLNCTVLIEVIFEQGQWIAVNCLKNPSTPFITALLKEGKFIPGSLLG